MCKEVKYEDNVSSNREKLGNSLVVQWLAFRTSTAGSMGSVPGRGTKILQAAWCGSKKKKKERKKSINRNYIKKEPNRSSSGTESTITEMKNLLEGLNSRFEVAF